LQRANGTSFAAPFVSAACALLAARANARAWPINGREARALLMGSCRPHLRADTVGCGAGVLDVWGALRALEDAIDADEADFDGPADTPSPSNPSGPPAPGSMTAAQRQKEQAW
jgi:hypothetical protein